MLKPTIEGEIGKQYGSVPQRRTRCQPKAVLSINGHPGNNIDAIRVQGPSSRTVSPTRSIYGNWTLTLHGKFMGVKKIENHIVVKIEKVFAEMSKLLVRMHHMLHLSGAPTNNACVDIVV